MKLLSAVIPQATDTVEPPCAALGWHGQKAITFLQHGCKAKRMLFPADERATNAASTSLPENVHTMHRSIPLALVVLAGMSLQAHGGGDETNLLTNGDFSSGTSGWTVAGDVTHQSTGGPAGHEDWVAMTSDQVTDTILTQTLTELQPMNRYTVCAKVRTDNNNLPPTLTINGDVQLLKSKGYIDLVEVSEWVEWRFEFFVNDVAAPSVDVQLICARTLGPDITPAIDFADVRVFYGRLAEMPTIEPWRPAWTEPPPIYVAPGAGSEIVLNGEFDQGADGSDSWSLYNCEVVNDGGTAALKATSSDTTAVATQVAELSLPPQSSWTVSCWGKADAGVTGSMALEDDGLSGTTSVSINTTDWTQFSFTVETTDEWATNPSLKLSCYKDQSGSASFRDVTWVATGEEWTATSANPPVAQTSTFTDDFSGGLSLDNWLVSNHGWGGDNGGVWWLRTALLAVRPGRRTSIPQASCNFARKHANPSSKAAGGT